MNAPRLHLDFETRSPVDLRAHGVYAYAQHAETDVMCTGYAFDDEEPEIACWSDLPDRIEQHVRAGGIVIAHNAPFEWAIWNLCCVKKYDWPPLAVDQLDCTMARAYAMGLPGALENLAPALGLDAKKDNAGARLMMKLSKPKSINDTGEINWQPYDEDEFARLHAYCMQDVRVERAADKRMLALRPSERKIWALDHGINTRGVYCDVESAQRATQLVEMEKQCLNLEMREVTGNQVAALTAVQQLKDWLKSDQGVHTDGLDQSAVTSLLARPDLAPRAHRALEIRQEGSKSSTAKLKAFIARANADQRIRGWAQYHGATTGRWAGRGIQPHNFPRKKYSPDFFETLAQHGHDPEMMRLVYGSPTGAISNALRGFLCAAPGKKLLCADWNAIEARGLAWLADETRVLELFIRGEDVYREAASHIYGVPVDRVTEEQRQVGKVAILALGYQGGVNAFREMAKGYGLQLYPVAQDLWDRAPAERRDRAKWGWNQRGKASGIDKREWIAAELIKLAWREANPHVVAYWKAVEEAACRAVTTGELVRVGRIAYKTSGSFLFCRLPSGRALCYPYPKIRETKTPWGELKPLLRYKAESSAPKGFFEFGAYGGLLVENITQGVCRDVLAEAMLRVEERGYPVVLHVHDEIVAEVDERDAAKSLEEFLQIVEEVPAWASGLPLKAGGWSGVRYRK